MKRNALPAVAGLALTAGAICADAASLHAAPWGVTREGVKVEQITIGNDRGMRVSLIDYGAAITSLQAPDRRGQTRNIVLGFADLAAYENTRYRYAGVVGRYAGRIGGARFVLDGREVALTPNANGLTLHGGPDSYDHRVWRRRDFSDRESLGSEFTLTSADGDQRFPGRLEISVSYRLLRARNELRIEYRAATDAPTVLNLTNHAYFNLAGAGNAGLDTHRFQIAADRYAEVDSHKVPTGKLHEVAGTPLDFRHPAGIANRLTDPWLGTGYDHSLLVPGWTGKLQPVALIEETASGRRMQVLSTEPSLQFNSGNGFDGSEPGAEGRAYQSHDGFALETQHLPDSPNHADFPSTVLRPGQMFRSTTVLRFSVAPAAKH